MALDSEGFKARNHRLITVKSVKDYWVNSYLATGLSKKNFEGVLLSKRIVNEVIWGSWYITNKCEIKGDEALSFNIPAL